jgi:hypothetical protein
MKALFRTRCGCEKIIQVYGYPPPEFYDLPMIEEVSREIISTEEHPAPTVQTRRFRLTRLINGSPLYLEQIGGAVHGLKGGGHARNKTNI